MKALTLHQPFASLIAVGAKRIETRSWSTKYRGPLAIHAGKAAPRDLNWVGPYGECMANSEWTYALLNDEGGHGMSLAAPLPIGAVVASARLVDVVPTESLWHCDPAQWADSDEDAEHLRSVGWGTDGGTPAFVVADQLPFGDFTPGRFAWLLEDVVPVEDRCPWCHDLASGYERLDCPVCEGAGKCDPIPAKGRQGLFEWTPVSQEQNT